MSNDQVIKAELKDVSAYNVVVLQLVNRRKMHSSGLQTKIDLLRNSTTSVGSTVLGWKRDYPMEVVVIDCPALYQNPRLKEQGIFNADDLRAAFKAKMQAELARVGKDKSLPESYADVINKFLATEQTHVCVSGIHRGTIFPEVLAYYMDQHKTDSTFEFTDVIPCRLLAPASYDALVNEQRRQNLEGESQIPETNEDLVLDAVRFIRAGLKPSTFRHWASTGQMPRDKQPLVSGKNIQKHWYIARADVDSPKLQIAERLQIDKGSKDPELVKKRIDWSCITHVANLGGSLAANIMNYLYCTSQSFRDEYHTSGRAVAEPPRESEMEAIKLDPSKQWDEARKEEWWNLRCPQSGLPNAGDMGVPKKEVVAEKSVLTLSKASPSSFVKEVFSSVVLDNTKDITIDEQLLAFGEKLQPIAAAIDAAAGLLSGNTHTQTNQLLLALDAYHSAKGSEAYNALLHKLNDVVVEMSKPVDEEKPKTAKSKAK